jgi:hypothetical protein
MPLVPRRKSLRASLEANLKMTDIRIPAQRIRLDHLGDWGASRVEGTGELMSRIAT